MKGDIRKARKKTSLIKETETKLVIAGLRVMTNENIPNGFMIVSPDEGKRLADMVAKATANAQPKTAETAETPTDETQEEGK